MGAERPQGRAESLRCDRCNGVIFEVVLMAVGPPPELPDGVKLPEVKPVLCDDCVEGEDSDRGEGRGAP